MTITDSLKSLAARQAQRSEIKLVTPLVVTPTKTNKKSQRTFSLAQQMMYRNLFVRRIDGNFNGFCRSFAVLRKLRRKQVKLKGAIKSQFEG